MSNKIKGLFDNIDRNIEYTLATESVSVSGTNTSTNDNVIVEEYGNIKPKINGYFDDIDRNIKSTVTDKITSTNNIDESVKDVVEPKIFNNIDSTMEYNLFADAVSRKGSKITTDNRVITENIKKVQSTKAIVPKKTIKKNTENVPITKLSEGTIEHTTDLIEDAGRFIDYDSNLTEAVKSTKELNSIITKAINKWYKSRPNISGGGVGSQTVREIIKESIGGSNKSVQFNDLGASFGGDSYFLYDKDTHTLTVPNLSAHNINVSGTDLDHTSTINEIGTLYLSGTSGTDGGTRFALDNGIPVVQKNNAGAWQKTEMEFASGSIFLGKNLKLSTAGHEFMTERADDTKKHLYARSTYSGGDTGSEDPVKIVNLEDLDKVVVILDQPTNLVGQDLYLTITSGFNQMLKDLVVKIDGTNATEPVLVTVYEGGSSFTGSVVWEEVYPAEMFTLTTYTTSAINSPTSPGRTRFLINPNQFKPIFEQQEMVITGFTSNPTYNGTYYIDVIADDGSWFEDTAIAYGTDEVGIANTNEVIVPSKGLIQFEPSSQYAFRFRSDSTMSIKAFIAYNRYKYHYNDFLVTQEWSDTSTTYAIGDWHIDHATEKIYACNVAGAQTGTFVSNSANWDDISTQAITQPTGDSSTKIATTAYVDNVAHTSTINEIGTLYLSGTSGTDGGIRFALDSSTDFATIQKNNSGAWQKTEMEFAGGSIVLGKNNKISTAGHELMTERINDDQKHLYARSTFSGGDTGHHDPVKIVNFDDVLKAVIIYDEPTEQVGTELYLGIVTTGINSMLRDLIVKIGSVPATSDST